MQEEEEEPCDEIHPLAVVEVGVDDGVGEQDSPKVGIVDPLGEAEGPLDVLLDLVLNLDRQVKLRLLLVSLKFTNDELGVNL